MTGPTNHGLRLSAGEVLFGTDSHTCNAGAFGQFASGVGNTDAGFILGTGKLLIKVTMASFTSRYPILQISGTFDCDPSCRDWLCGGEQAEVRRLANVGTCQAAAVPEKLAAGSND